MGRFGQAEARRARRFCLSVQYCNRNRVHSEVESELEATFWESLDQMLVHMDVISITCPHIPPATLHLLSERKLVKPQAYIVNTSRGEVIDEYALAHMLAKGEIA